MASTNVKITRIEDSVGDINNKQICVEPGNDPDTGYRMWAGKDGAGNTYKFLGKSKPAYIESLNVSDFSTAGLLSSDSSGDVTANVNTLAELNTLITDATLDDEGDPRDPNAHASTHYTGGSDPLSFDLDDVVTNDGTVDVDSTTKKATFEDSVITDSTDKDETGFEDLTTVQESDSVIDTGSGYWGGNDDWLFFSSNTPAYTLVDRKTLKPKLQETSSVIIATVFDDNGRCFGLSAVAVYDVDLSDLSITSRISIAFGDVPIVDMYNGLIYAIVGSTVHIIDPNDWTSTTITTATAITTARGFVINPDTKTFFVLDDTGSAVVVREFRIGDGSLVNTSSSISTLSGYLSNIALHGDYVAQRWRW